uniref:LisH domain-containing protein n=1 Tax=Panagrolaimus sp. JU765 TaxID=591449 RepID=A0AC34QH35_9BILA
MPLDVLVKEYLLMHGYSKTVTVFDDERKNDVVLQDSVDKYVSQIFQYIEEYSVNRFLEFWKFLNEKVFISLLEPQASVAADVETAVYKLYVVNCIKNGRHDKAHEFFSKIVDFTRNDPNWAEWFCLPYLKNPAKEKAFEKYFLPHWQACLIVWLYNFLSIAVQQMEKPRLLLYVEKAVKKDEPTPEFSNSTTVLSNFEEGLTDDFAVIAQVGTPNSKTSSRSLRTIFKSFAGK